MTTAVMSTIANPFRGFFKGFNNFCEVVGYSRAAAHLSSLGYHEEAKHCIMEIARLRGSK